MITAEIDAPVTTPTLPEELQGAWTDRCQILLDSKIEFSWYNDSILRIKWGDLARGHLFSCEHHRAMRKLNEEKIPRSYNCHILTWVDFSARDTNRRLHLAYASRQKIMFMRLTISPCPSPHKRLWFAPVLIQWGDDLSYVCIWTPTCCRKSRCAFRAIIRYWIVASLMRRKNCT